MTTTTTPALRVGRRAGAEYLERFGLHPEQAAGLRALRHARQTGALVSLYDGDEAGLDTDGGRWQTVCETHGSICSHDSLATAASFLAEPAAWCEPCQEVGA